MPAADRGVGAVPEVGAVSYADGLDMVFKLLGLGVGCGLLWSLVVGS